MEFWVEHLIHQAKRTTTNRSADRPEILLNRQLLVRRALTAAVGTLKPGDHMLKGWEDLPRSQPAEGPQRDVGDASTSAMLLGSGKKPDPSSMAADVAAMEKLTMDGTADIDEESSWRQAGFLISPTEGLDSDGLYSLRRFDRATLPDGEEIHAMSYKRPKRASYWALVLFHDLGWFAARISHFILVRGPASQILRVAICDCYKVSQRVGFNGTTYEAPCMRGQSQPTLEPHDAGYPILLSELKRKLVWYDGAIDAQVGNKWQFVSYPNYKPREAQDEPFEDADNEAAADASDDDMDDDVL